MTHEFCLALCTFPNEETARKISRQLIDEALAACANITPGIASIYFWEGKIEEGSEVLTIFKLTNVRFHAFAARLKALHPYEVPEIIKLPVAEGEPEYLRWVRESCARR